MRRLLLLCAAASASSPSACSNDAPPTPPAPSFVAGPVRWIAVGGGGAPESNQVSIEQDLALAAKVLGPSGELLFAGGPGTAAVQVQDGGAAGDPVLAELGALFAPRAGRDATYRATTLRVDAPARAVTLRERLAAARRAGGAPLLLYVAGHGELGETAADNFADLWGGDHLSAKDLAAWLEDDQVVSSRLVRLVATTCFSGGFAELAFARAEPSAGAPAQVRCGLFAATDDLPASGCDPNPDRVAQEGYALHFWQALAALDRDGKPLPPEAIDFDGDGKVSLLEAHARVRIASRGGEVPTTTSDRWLREALASDVAPESGGAAPTAAFDLPEDEAAAAALGHSTGLGTDLARVTSELDMLETRITELNDQLTAAADAEDQAYRDVAAELLSRWPVLDDPWHPQFAATWARDRAAIGDALRTSKTYAAYQQAAAAHDHADAAVWDLRLRAAPVERLERALENLEMAPRLAAIGGPALATYRELLACERTVP